MIRLDHIVTITEKCCPTGKHVFPSLNQYLGAQSSSPHKAYRMKIKCMNAAQKAVDEQLHGWKPTTPVIIHYSFGEYNKGQKRDRGNILALADKFIEDALVKRGVLPDDNPNYVLNIVADSFEYVGEPYIKVMFEEVENEQYG